MPVLALTGGSDGRETEKKLDADCVPLGISEQDITSLGIIPNSEEPTKDAAPFLPRFLLQEIICEHSPHDDRYLLCSADWLCLRGTAGTECGILPIREIATHRQCSACARTSSGELPTARRSLPAPEPVNKFCWQLAESQQHNQPERRGDEFDADVVSFLPRFLLQELIFASPFFQPSVQPSFPQNFVSSPVRGQHPRTSVPTTGHHRSYSTTTPGQRDSELKFRAEMQREETSEWTVLLKEEPSSGNGMPAKQAEQEEARSVLPRGSVIRQNITKLASIATRSTAAQTVNPVSDGSSLQ